MLLMGLWSLEFTIYAISSVIFTDFLKITSMWSQIALTVITVLGTMLFGLLFGLATVKLKSDQTISGFAINILALGVVSVVVLYITSRHQGGGTTIDSILKRRELAWSSEVGSFKNIISLKTFLVIIIAFGSWFALRKTRWGLRFRSVGENPQASLM
ncbi:ABC transporter permease subunit [Mycoplasmopsis cynos]|uniref:ABC transporter permease subunit n=1 Tax=Mycoplasmopsis cynos TaxID=171284 RepID=UPI0024C8C110|nr:hypothetical protein [Mycoplasmopsis cynos]WAM04738.1 hypothetical protein ONA01_00620 [Mycoplasmopsis cynos]